MGDLWPFRVSTLKINLVQFEIVSGALIMEGNLCSKWRPLLGFF